MSDNTTRYSTAGGDTIRSDDATTSKVQAMKAATGGANLLGALASTDNPIAMHDFAASRLCEEVQAKFARMSELLIMRAHKRRRRVTGASLPQPKYGMSAFDMAALQLSGWWRADIAANQYNGAPWTPTTSAGGSGSNGNLVVGNAPGNGPTQNGYTPASFTLQWLQTANAPTTYLTLGAGTIIVLANLSSVPVTSGTSYTDPTLCGTQGSVEVEMTVSDNGAGGGNFVCHYFDGAHHDTTAISFSTNVYHLFAMTWDGSTVSAYVDNGAPQTVAAGAIDNLAFAALNVGVTFDNLTAFISGNILEVVTSAVALPASTLTKIGSQLQARYALSMGFP
jgi:hypothetical protein